MFVFVNFGQARICVLIALQFSEVLSSHFTCTIVCKLWCVISLNHQLYPVKISISINQLMKMQGPFSILSLSNYQSMGKSIMKWYFLSSAELINSFALKKRIGYVHCSMSQPFPLLSYVSVVVCLRWLFLHMLLVSHICIYPGKVGFCFFDYCAVLWCVQIIKYIAWWSYMVICTLHYLIIILMQTYLKVLNCLSDFIFCLECLSKIRSILSMIFHAIYGAVCIQLTQSSNQKYDPFDIV